MGLFGYPDVFFRWQAEIPEKLSRVVVGIDPPFSPKDRCGIVVAGRGAHTGIGYVLDDRTVAYENPAIWAQHICQAALEFDADLVAIAGDENIEFVSSLLARSGISCGIKPVRFMRNRVDRFRALAEVHAKEQIIYASPFKELMRELTNVEAPHIPIDRANALLAAMFELLMKPPPAYYRGAH